jgi:hypothetical protein
MITKLNNRDLLEPMTTVESNDIELLLNYYSVDGEIKCNLNTGITIDAAEAAFETFHLTTSMFWPQISHLIYKTTSLYWLLQQLNPDLTTNCFDKVEAPAHIRYLPQAVSIMTTQQY